MAIRWFQTDDGVTWHVRNVLPGLADEERRTGYDRRSPDPVFRHAGPERRVNPDRRKPAPFLNPELACGWLAFESENEKRRLAPIPQRWESLSDAELTRLCAQARVVQLPGPRQEREQGTGDSGQGSGDGGHVSIASDPHP
jgi:hypothetical protein